MPWLIDRKNKQLTEHEFADIAQFFFEKKNWCYKKTDIKLVINKSGLIFKSKNDKAKYVNLFEDNTNYQFINSDSNKIILNRENSIKISGDVSAGLGVIIYLIEYSGTNKQLKKHRIQLNKMNSILAQPDARYARIAVRISGEGEIVIKEVFASPYISKSYSHGTTAEHLSEIKIACILGEENTKNFSQIVSVIPFDLNNWEVELSKNKPDFLLVESIMYDDRNKHLIDNTSENKNKVLKHLVLWCRTNNIPTILWDTQFPKHADDFLYSMIYFDIILTVDNTLILKYREYLGHNQVFYMPPAVTHNDIEQIKNTPLVSLYYDSKRTRLEILANFKDYPIKLTDTREEGTKPALLKEMMGDLATGIPIVRDKFSLKNNPFQDLILTGSRENEVKALLEELLNKPGFYQKLSRNGIREMFRYNTYKHWLEFLLNLLNIEYQPLKELTPMTLVFSIKSSKTFINAVNVLNKQSYNHIKGIFFISVFAGYDELVNKYSGNDSITIYFEDYVKHNYTITDIANTKYMIRMNACNDYDPYYIEDIILFLESFPDEERDKEIDKKIEYLFKDKIENQSSEPILYILDKEKDFLVSELINDCIENSTRS